MPKRTIVNMKLCFETQLEQPDGVELPTLVNVAGIHVGAQAEGLTIDGKDIALGEHILQGITDAIAMMNDERLPMGHFRDCASFTMAVCGVWLPTFTFFDTKHELKQVCDESDMTTAGLAGPVATGYPNDASCLGFGDANFVYSHLAYGLESSEGNLFAYKAGMEPEYCIVPLETMLADYSHDVAHTVETLRVMHTDQGELVRWDRND